MSASERVGVAASAVANISRFSAHEFAAADFEWMHPAAIAPPLEAAGGARSDDPPRDENSGPTDDDGYPSIYSDRSHEPAQLRTSWHNRSFDYTDTDLPAAGLDDLRREIRKLRSDIRYLLEETVLSASGGRRRGLGWGLGGLAAAMLLVLALYLAFRDGDASGGADLISQAKVPSTQAPSNIEAASGSSAGQAADKAGEEARISLRRYFDYLTQQQFEEAAGVWTGDERTGPVTAKRLAQGLGKYSSYDGEVLDIVPAGPASEEIIVAFVVTAVRLNIAVRSPGRATLKRSGSQAWKLRNLEFDDALADPLQ